MPSILDLLKVAGKAGIRTGKFATQLGMGSNLERMALGGAIGAGLGLATDDHQDITQRLGAGIRGGILGVGIGSVGVLPSIYKNIPARFKTGRFSPKNISKAIGKAGMGAGLFAAEHPWTTAGLAGAGAFLATDTTPYYSNINEPRGFQLRSTVNQENAMVDELSGSLPSNTTQPKSLAAVRQQQLAQSTYGLVQGLFARRH